MEILLKNLLCHRKAPFLRSESGQYWLVGRLMPKKKDSSAVGTNTDGLTEEGGGHEQPQPKIEAEVAQLRQSRGDEDGNKMCTMWEAQIQR